MRIRIDHATRYAYARPARFIVQMLRLTPKSCESQQVRDWRIETDVDARLRRSEDAFGNIVHSLYTERPTDDLTIRVTGEVSTVDTGGVIRGQNEKLSPSVYLRETRLTRPDAALTAFADTAGQGGALDRMHRLMGAIHQAVAFDVGATSATHSAAEAFALRRGVCQDHAQIFIACARADRRPARPGRRPRLGRGLDRRSGLGRLRSRERHLPDRSLRSGRHRPGRAGGHADPGNQLRRRRREPDGRPACAPGATEPAATSEPGMVLIAMSSESASVRRFAARGADRAQ